MAFSLEVAFANTRCQAAPCNPAAAYSHLQ